MLYTYNLTCIHVQAAGILRNLSISAPHGKTMVSDGAVPLLVDLLKVNHVFCYVRVGVCACVYSTCAVRGKTMVSDGAVPLCVCVCVCGTVILYMYKINV